jgi:hypothetical protein
MVKPKLPARDKAKLTMALRIGLEPNTCLKTYAILTVSTKQTHYSKIKRIDVNYWREDQ